jgi:hypothetical protein
MAVEPGGGGSDFLAPQAHCGSEVETKESRLSEPPSLCATGFPLSPPGDLDMGTVWDTLPPSHWLTASQSSTEYTTHSFKTGVGAEIRTLKSGRIHRSPPVGHLPLLLPFPVPDS